MISPYRATHVHRRAIDAQVDEMFRWLDWVDASDETRKQIRETREAFTTGHLDAAEALFFLRRVSGALDDLPTALPTFEGDAQASRSGLDGRITDLRVWAHQAVFRFDGHPMVHDALGDQSIALHTSVRRGVPHMRVVARDSLSIEGSAFALVPNVTLPLLRLGRIARATTLSVNAGLATIAWCHDVTDTATHALALECLVALRNVRSPVP
jgi:hypothetical protein